VPPAGQEKKMPTEKKRNQVRELEGTISRSNIIVLSDYKGVTASQMNILRRRLKESNSEIRVVKNTLARLAASQSGKEALAESLRGTTAITFGYGEITAPVKVLIGFQSEAEGLTIKGGLLGDAVYSKEEISSLATLPRREVLIAHLLAQMNAPISRLVTVLASPVRGILGVLQARINQLEEK
jgi:large subunit ribosomal protein L10